MRIVALLALLLAARAFVHVNPARRPTPQLVDDQGRERLFHGVNAVYKIAPFVPPTGAFDPDTSLGPADVAFLQANGLNVVRLNVAWPGVAPTAGAVNKTYLNAVKDIVDALGAAGIYTILDCHQDLFSPKFCGEGVPDYATLYPGKSKPFPEPVGPAFVVNSTTGYPTDADCKKHPFFYYMISDAVSKAFQSFYDNDNGIQDLFVAFWQEVAAVFADSASLLGYEIINEPWAGDFYSRPDLLSPNISDKVNLQPLYARVHAAIRKVDSEHCLFFEPTVATTALPLPKFSRTGLTEGPGGPAFNDRQVFSYHDYCQLLTADGQPLSAPVCADIDKAVYFKTRMADLSALSVAGFVTEWGVLNSGNATDAAYAQQFLSHTNANLQSWAYWSFKSYHDITTQAREPDGTVQEGLWDKNGTLLTDKLRLLSYTYPQAVAGNLQKFS